MPLALLRRISRECLPLILMSNEDVEAAAILVLAGHVNAAMQVVFDRRGGAQPGMVVTEITRLGWRMLEAFRSLQSRR
ncbi:hypothetical protein [Variovorax sp. MHTC-1]|uniref:hypothetical protein n=1 Tax=Variovorax sp. MHTC-1 TaxID=2495593 RepID=UPI000F882122|nr:hypothetical protein [Variovorax sp. MHTC-1]RST47889.1 hypothetical protein EJI01_27595 [Variovorax sp. MHTC-1]